MKEIFDAVSKRYDLLNTVMSFGRDKSWRKKVVQVVKAEPKMHILDVCCGTAELTKEIAKAVGPHGRVTGIDFSEKMLSEAAQKLEKSPLKSNISLLQGDALNLPFKDNYFDGATIGWGLRNLADLRQGLREMYRVVKPGSMVVSIDMGKPSLPIYKQLYWLYFKKVIPFLGHIWAGKRKEYFYLYQSAQDFKSQIKLVEDFQNCGFVKCGHLNLAGGAIAIVYGQKPESCN
ncbi:MAG: demethylmenaquinone methyltransferase [Desulfitobacteriia bacterium]|jgi:demethylmenaquinone methyltransferase/2-methoxy-6-polyprenyl-1,4-benzoquinol methylase